MSQGREIVVVHQLSKQYGATLALDAVDLTVASGEVHALLGHNGAGKSTLIKCLGGGVPPTSGSITIDGETYAGLDPRRSIGAGVAVIYQHLSLVDALTVTENLFLGQELTRGGLVRASEQRQVAERSLEGVGADIHPDTLVGELPAGHRQLVEIAKALQRNARLLVLDEPSAALSRAEYVRLAALVRDLRESGLAILYVTHLLEEVMELADRATVMRDGRVVWTSDLTGVGKADLVTAISGEAHAGGRTGAPTRSGSPVLDVRELRGPAFGEVDLQVGPGEIVGLFGLIGSGRGALLETLFGRRRRDGGVVRVDGSVVRVDRPGAGLAAGIALVPGDRIRQGLFPILSSSENTLTRVMGQLARLGLRRRSAEREVFGSMSADLGLRPADPDLSVRSLSGGNQQKVLIGRWVNSRSTTRVLLMDQPSQGVDVASRAEIHRAVRHAATERRMAVLFSTNDPEEAAELAHRCLVMADGRVVEEVQGEALTPARLVSSVHREPAPS